MGTVLRLGCIAVSARCLSLGFVRLFSSRRCWSGSCLPSLLLLCGNLIEPLRDELLVRPIIDCRVQHVTVHEQSRLAKSFIGLCLIPYDTLGVYEERGAGVRETHEAFPYVVRLSCLAFRIAQNRVLTAVFHLIR